jgi:hypothetical protein
MPDAHIFPFTFGIKVALDSNSYVRGISDTYARRALFTA